MKPDFDRPSRHGQYLGEALVLLAREGRKVSDAPLPDPCLTCAFRRGTLPNMTAGTVFAAFNCAVGVDKDEFACHHGMDEGCPTKLCSGYVAAILAPFERMKEIFAPLAEQLARLDGPDMIRADFDAWYAKADPDGKMDVYQLARAYAGRT